MLCFYLFDPPQKDDYTHNLNKFGTHLVVIAPWKILDLNLSVIFISIQAELAQFLFLRVLDFVRLC